MTKRRKAINYLSNRELLREIHKSKISYCEFDKPEYADFDMIVTDLAAINDAIIEQAKKNKCYQLNEIKGDELFEEEGYTNKEIEEYMKKNALESKDFTKKDIVIRLMTHDHIPDSKDKKNKKGKVSVNFPPFQHFVWKDKQWTCVGKSHWKDEKFNPRGGNITNQLALSFMKLVDKYSQKGNWRNYTWLSEMSGTALAKLVQVGLQFDENKSQNPFAYFTTILNHAFTIVLNDEKKLLATKSKLIQESGFDASYGEQADHDMGNYARDNE